MQMLFAILAAVGVYLLVPREISIGEVQLQSDHMSWNTTRGTYQLKLLAKIPIYNPNYMKVCSAAIRLHPAISGGSSFGRWKVYTSHLVLRCTTHQPWRVFSQQAASYKRACVAVSRATVDAQIVAMYLYG